MPGFDKAILYFSCDVVGVLCYFFLLPVTKQGLNLVNRQLRLAVLYSLSELHSLSGGSVAVKSCNVQNSLFKVIPCLAVVTAKCIEINKVCRTIFIPVQPDRIACPVSGISVKCAYQVYGPPVLELADVLHNSVRSST